MSAAGDESEDIDLPHEMSSDNIPSPQIDSQHALDDTADGNASAYSDDFVQKSSASQYSEDEPVHGSSQNRELSLANRRRIVPAIALNPFAEEESYYARPNRYFGPDSTWLSWTKEDRLVAQTLDRLRSQDLSIHLFNAYALKRQGQTYIRRKRKIVRGKACARSVDSRDDSDGDRAEGFVPPRTWTAWPLPPNQVPRETDMSMPDGYNYAMDPDTRPSAILEDCIVATTTRLARERWKSRKWAPASHIIERPTLKLEQGVDVEMTQDQQPTVQSDTEAAETLSTDSEPGSGMFESQPWDMIDQAVAQASTNKDYCDVESGYRPTPIADDESARSVLLPGTRHILSKLDDLLIGLHHARQAYATTTPHVSSKTKEADIEVPNLTEMDESETTTRQQRKRKRSRATSSSSATKAESKHPRRSKEPLNPRDWSDIIGMASLTNWDPATVERASERCAKLFGENMLFRTFFPGDVSKRQHPYFTEHFAVSDESSGSESDNKIKTSAEQVDMVVVRKSRACTTCTRHKERCEPANSTHAGSGPCKRCTTRSEADNCSGITTALRKLPTSSKSAETHCPHPSCPRHTIPFKKSYHLQRHITTTHKSSPIPSPAVPRPLTVHRQVVQSTSRPPRRKSSVRS